MRHMNQNYWFYGIFFFISRRVLIEYNHQNNERASERVSKRSSKINSIDVETRAHFFLAFFYVAVSSLITSLSIETWTAGSP